MRTEGDRLAYLDGLRGLAVLLVLLFHAWVYLISLSPSAGPAQSAAWQIGQYWGNEGVSLFLVLSGFCLALGPLARRAKGDPVWFRPSEFFARRCLRILPTYYAALATCVAFRAVCAWRQWPAFGSESGYGLGFGDIFTHALLIHNLTPYTYALNGPFWSLALEWQWYWVFPVVLLGVMRRPRLTLAAAACLSCVWTLCVVYFALTGHGSAPPLLGVGQAPAAVPARLFEFTCGVAAARLATRSVTAVRLSALLPILACLLFAGTLLVWPLTAAYGMNSLLGGAAFATVVVLAGRSPALCRMLGRGPLVRLGVVSYSVYLAHLLPLQPLEYLLVGRVPGAFAACAGVIVGIVAGLILYACVERWSIRRSTWEQWGVRIVACLAWTDAAYSRRRMDQNAAPESASAPA
ncbi:MAG TPA: acyltransferase [Chloroflexota bacterium]|nr:acyltransferase [Chloroflexota bacterium]